jgi:hypothetical protein
VQPTAQGLTITPRLPTETYAVRFPWLALSSTPDRMEVGYVAGAPDTVVITVRLPSMLRGAPVAAAQDGTSTPVTIDGELASVTVLVRAGARTTITFEPAP